MDRKRFDIYFDKFLGFGIHWSSFIYSFEIHIRLPLVTVYIGVGKPAEIW